MTLREIQVEALAPHHLEALIGPDRSAKFEQVAATARDSLAGRRVLNVNSTAAGGGVAELLQALLSYARGVGVDTRWFVIEGNVRFFEITKRIHNRIYGAEGDGGPLGAEEHRDYQAVLDRNGDQLLSVIRPHDILVLHDPQTAGLAQVGHDAGAAVVWRGHIGCDTPNDANQQGWEFLRPYIEAADAYVFTMATFAPAWLDRTRLHVIPPSIDPFSAKNAPLDEPSVRGILQYVGLLGGRADPPSVAFARRDGSPGRIDRRVDILQTGPPPPPAAPLVVQVSRWDHMKDMAGVLEGFALRAGRLAGARPRPRRPDRARRRRRPRGRRSPRRLHRSLAATTRGHP